jgi:ribosomal-protein-alanine N-acetyltransferase
VSELELVRADHAAAVLDFELANRAWFARSISDRGDAWFREFAARHRDLLAEQQAGECAYYLLLDDDGAVLGRFNLYDIADGGARVGYRVAESAAGRGLATAALRELCRLAAERHGVTRLEAATSDQNLASQRVLAKAGFVPVGPADPADLGGKPGRWYRWVSPAGP